MNENIDEPQDFESTADSGFDNEFSEFDQDAEKGSFSDLVKKNPVVKIGLVAAALLVVIGGVAMFGGSDVKAPDSVVGGGNDNLKAKVGSDELTPAMKEIVQEVNEQRTEEALRQGTSVIPQPIETPKASLQAPVEETTAEDPLLRWKVIQEERLKAQQTEQNNQTPEVNQAKDQARQALAQAMTGQMSQILAEKKPLEIKSMVVTDLNQLIEARRQQMEQQQGGTATGINPVTGELTSQSLQQQTVDANGQIVPLVQPKIILPAGSIEYGQLLIEANSDVVGPIVAMVVSGPFSGSRVIGSFQTADELLVLQFSTLVNKKGISIPINAYALDPDTTLTGMATDVDKRYWERIILPAASEFVTGLAEAYSERQGQTTVVTGDTVVQDQPPLDIQEQVAKGIQSAGDKVGEILDDEGANTKPLVKVKAGTPMGILFLAAITDQDLTAGQNAPETARTIAQQRQQQSLLQQQLGNNASQQNPFYLIQGLQGAQNLQAGQNDTQQNQQTGSVSGNGSALPANIFSTQQYLNNQ